MKTKVAKAVSITLVALLVLSMLTIAPALSGFPPRSYNGPGTGYATFYVTPQDSNFTSTKPLVNKTCTWFMIQVRLKNYSDVSTYQFQLIWKTALLSTTSDNITIHAADYVFKGIAGVTPFSVSIDPFNATYTRALVTQGTYNPVKVVSGADAGVVDIWFHIEADPDGPSGVLSTLLFFATDMTGSTDDTWTLDLTAIDENDCTMEDGYYENRYVPPPPMYLEVSPAVTEMPVIEGDRIVGTPRAKFSVDILIHNVNPMDELFLVQFEIKYRHDLITGIWIDEGTFMNDTAWAPYGTYDKMPIMNEVINATFSKSLYWIMISPDENGTWHPPFPSGDGLLAIVSFEVIWQGEDPDGGPLKDLLDSSPLVLQGIFDEFFLGHPNDTPVWLPYDPPVNGRVDIYGYYWQAPVAIKTHPPSAMVGTPVTFDGSASYGFRNVLGVLVPDVTYIAMYDWDFGDLTPHGSGPIVVHTYMSTGVFTVTLTVWDLDNKTGSVSQPINIFSTWNLYLTIIGSPGDLVLLNPGPPGPLNPPVAYGPGAYTLVYNPGVTITATMIPNPGEDFNWVIDVTPGTSNPMLPIWMISPHWVTVTFYYINIDVYIGPGTGVYPSPYGGQGHNRVADMFEPQKTVCVWIKVTWNGEPVQSKVVTIIVLSPHGNHDFSRTAITDTNGYAYIEFGLPWPCDDPWNDVFGIWQIVVKVDIRSVVYEDNVWFKVYWLLEIVSVTTNKASYYKCQWVVCEVIFRTWRMQPFDTVVEITVYDDLDVPIGSMRVELHNIGWGNYDEARFWRCEFKYYKVYLEIHIPKYAFVGTGKVYANAFHFDQSNPYNMGVPMCPEKMTTFEILKTP